MSNCHYHTNNRRIEYKDCWIEIFLEPDTDQCDHFLYTALIELPNNEGVINCPAYPSFSEVEAASLRLIDLI